MIQLLGVLGLVGLVGGWVAGFGGAAVSLVGLVWVVCGLSNSVRGLLPPRPPTLICVGLVVGVWFGQFCVGVAAPRPPNLCGLVSGAVSQAVS